MTIKHKTEMDAFRAFNKIDWSKLPDNDLRLAYRLLQTHHIFEDITAEIIQEISYRIQRQKGFTLLHPDDAPVTISNAPDWLYKWPFRLLWKQSNGGGGDK